MRPQSFHALKLNLPKAAWPTNSWSTKVVKKRTLLIQLIGIAAAFLTRTCTCKCRTNVLTRKGLRGSHMGCQHDLADILLAQESSEERCWVGSRPQQSGICAVAVTIVGICGRCILACMPCKIVRKKERKQRRHRQASKTEKLEMIPSFPWPGCQLLIRRTQHDHAEMHCIPEP